MQIAVVGSGIAGLSCAWKLSLAGHQVSLFEANNYFGGHTNTVDIRVDDQDLSVDTGFLVFNERTYPELIALFAGLKVPSIATDMSFSVKVKQGHGNLEWAGSNLATVFAQPANLFRPGFWWMLKDILRFNQAATKLARTGSVDHGLSLGNYLSQHGYSQNFINWYLLPMAACIWSCPTAQMLEFPLLSFVRFCDNHGLLQISQRPRWFTVPGGARQYVEKLLEPIPNKYLNSAITRILPGDGHNRPRLCSADGEFAFDQIVLACHSDQSSALLAQATPQQTAILNAIPYQANYAVLHTDASCLPAARIAWSAWNYQSLGTTEPRVCVHYWLNLLQALPVKTPVIVSLNPIEEPAADKVLARFDYAHPVFGAAAPAAQQALREVQGHGGIWFAGAWTGYGFHEDGLKSGLKVAQQINLLAAGMAAQTRHAA